MPEGDLDCVPARLRVLVAGEELPVAVGPPAAYIRVRWSPDGGVIAALISPSCDELDRLVLVDADSDETVIVPLPDLVAPNGFSGLLWSPDSSRVAVYGDRLVIASRYGRIVLTEGPAADGTPILPGHWSDDGLRLAVIDRRDGAHIITKDGQTVSVTDAATSGLEGPMLVGWDGDQLLFWGATADAGTVAVRALISGGDSPQWGELQDPESWDPERYAKFFDGRGFELRGKVAEGTVVEEWLHGGAGVSSDGQTRWDMFMSDLESLAFTVVIGMEDGTLVEVGLPDVELDAPSAPILDVIVR